MSRFGVFRLRAGDMLAVDLQSNLLDQLPSRIMVPLIPVSDMSWSMTRLTPRFVINDQPYVMATQRMASVPASERSARSSPISRTGPTR